ncbi:MAG: multicopper oxidase domain-containing protein [Candidatus Babeliales bacterium]
MITNQANARLVKYHLTLSQETMTFLEKKAQAMLIDRQLPGPLIEATVGDILEVTFHNTMDRETSIHWHGIILPNDQDGVPYVTTQPIAPHSFFTYRFPVMQHGTYWYHSHKGLQGQMGLYGPLIFHQKKEETPHEKKVDKDYWVMFSDWTDEKPAVVLDHLKKGRDYYAAQKGTLQSWDKVIAHGKAAIKQRIENGLMRMDPMDISDVGYDLFLTNGEQEHCVVADEGDSVRLRLINSSASTYFIVEFAGGPMTIVAADGGDVEPVKVQRLRIATAETYDVLVTLDAERSYEVRATSEDGTGKTSLFVGRGERFYAPDIPKPNIFVMDHHHAMSDHVGLRTMDTDHDGHQQMDRLDVIEYMQDYSPLRALTDTRFVSDVVARERVMSLMGDMERYVWSFDNKIFVKSNRFLLKRGEVIRLIFDNQTMMHHPLHLHGHFFRVLNGQGEKSPLKHTVSIPPMEKRSIELALDKSGDWLFHCHNIYHMEAGMARVFSCDNLPQKSKSRFKKLIPDDWFLYGSVNLLHSMLFGSAVYAQARNSFEFEYDCDYHKQYSFCLFYVRLLTRFLDVYIGCDKTDTYYSQGAEVIAGIRYVLPLFILIDVRLYSTGRARLEVGSSFLLTEKIASSWYVNTDKDYRAVFSYAFNNDISLVAAYDSSYGWGVGLSLLF